MKPRIFMSLGVWVCQNQKRVGFGATPDHAYRIWVIAPDGIWQKAVLGNVSRETFAKSP